jgi:hypothetical protein
MAGHLLGGKIQVKTALTRVSLERVQVIDDRGPGWIVTVITDQNVVQKTIPLAKIFQVK